MVITLVEVDRRNTYKNYQYLFKKHVITIFKLSRIELTKMMTFPFEKVAFKLKNITHSIHSHGRYKPIGSLIKEKDSRTKR